MLTPRKEIKVFAEIMEAKLSQHDDRPHWNDEELDYLVARFDEEVKEFKEAIKSKNPNHIILEAADVANMAMMIADTGSVTLEHVGSRDKRKNKGTSKPLGGDDAGSKMPSK